MLETNARRSCPHGACDLVEETGGVSVCVSMCMSVSGVCVCGHLWVFLDVPEVTVDSENGKVVTRESEGPPSALVVRESL